MPRKPTMAARRAREALVRMAGRLGESEPFPVLEELGRRHGLHAATIFRILRDLAAEGVVWQSPSGRFFAARARRARLRGAPLCFLGRELWMWSRLYQELLEGVSEVCAANSSPLVALTARSLVRQESPMAAPVFAAEAVQIQELRALLPHVPPGCAGILLDHVWSPRALEAASWPGGDRVQLLCGAGTRARVVGPDFEQGARLAAGFAQSF
ncbi:MAG: hypothetical protein N2322_07905, partial [Terrimicrobiaceae bacterium]|nr:hypothetical protein [Terrimicrobiaceae bacterium]